MHIGPIEIIVAVVVVFILFGPKAISKLSRALGKAKSEFEKGLDEGKQEDSKDNP